MGTDVFRPVHRTIADRAVETPDAPAVTDDRGHLTYRELVDRSDELAAVLVRDGLRPGDAVAVHLPRGGALVVALLAVSRAGGASLMLDVDGPQGWLARFVDIARPVAWLADVDGPAPPDGRAHHRITADGRTDGPPPVGDPVVLPEVGPEDLACLVQTSGSTGAPKLVLVPHRTWWFATSTQRLLHAVDRAERGAWLFPAHTNVSVSVVVWPFLAAGAHLSVPPGPLLADEVELARWIRAERITQFFAVAPLAEALAKLAWPPSTLRFMLTGSDRVREWGRPDLPFEIGNWYGANEVNIVTSSIVPWERRITSATVGAADRSGPPPIGRAWPGTSWSVLAAGDRPAGPGEVGELVVGGRQVALGYHSPRLTAERFRPDESGDGRRVYRTGDLVRVRADGVFEHCGRVDEQVKVDGMRVEMAEVERAILDCPGVREAAAAAVETPAGRIRLVGYVVTDDPATDAELRARIAEVLPRPMVPVAFVRMDRLPRNRGDKIDRLALPAPDAHDVARADLPAVDGLGDRVAAVLARVLDLESCRPDDNFFLLGGDSLLATRVAKDLTTELGRPVSAREVILFPTAQELTDLVRSGAAGA